MVQRPRAANKRRGRSRPCLCGSGTKSHGVGPGSLGRLHRDSRQLLNLSSVPWHTIRMVCLAKRKKSMPRSSAWNRRMPTHFTFQD